MSIQTLASVFRLRILSCLLAVTMVSLLHGSLQQQPIASEELSVIVSQLPISSVPQRTDVMVEPAVSALSAYITDENSGAVLYSKNATLQYAPASVTKLMTVLVTQAQYAPRSVVTVPVIPAAIDSRRLFSAGDQVLLEDMVAASLIQSSNDAAFVLASQMPGGSEAFVEKMNEMAEQLQLRSTSFADSIGFDHPQQKTTARDVTLLAREVLRNPINSQLVALQSKEFYDISGLKAYTLINTNQLLHTDARITGVKTGTTSEAGQVLVSRANIDGNTVLITVLGSQDRYLDTVLLLDWLERVYIWEEVDILHFSDSLSVLY